MDGTQGHECGRSEPTTALPSGGTSVELMPSPASTFPPLAVRKDGHGVMSSRELAFPACTLPAATLGKQAPLLTWMAQHS